MYNMYQYQQNYNNPFYGYGYPQQQTTIKPVQPLTQEQVAQLRNNGDATSIKLTPEEILRARCTHKDPSTGRITLNEIGNGAVQCSICGATFNPETKPIQVVEDAVLTVLDFLQQTKLFWLTAPKEVPTEYMPIIPLLEKLPKLYSVAVDNYTRWEGGANLMMNNPQINGFAGVDYVLGTGMVPGYAGYYGPQQFQMPVYGQQMQQQMPQYGFQPGYQMPMQQQYPMYGQPMQQQAPMGAPQQMQQQAPMGVAPQGGNPFGVESTGYQMPMQQPVQQPQQAPMGAPQPMQQAPVFSAAPQQPSAPMGAPQAPQAPAQPANDAVVVEKQFTL